jgi:hypothetical protein
VPPSFVGAKEDEKPFWYFSFCIISSRSRCAIGVEYATSPPSPVFPCEAQPLSMHVHRPQACPASRDGGTAANQARDGGRAVSPAFTGHKAESGTALHVYRPYAAPVCALVAPPPACTNLPRLADKIHSPALDIEFSSFAHSLNISAVAEWRSQDQAPACMDCKSRVRSIHSVDRLYLFCLLRRYNNEAARPASRQAVKAASCYRNQTLAQLRPARHHCLAVSG